MITAVEALRLPRVRLTEDDYKNLKKTMDAIEVAVRDNMLHHGVVINFPGMPPAYTIALAQMLEPFGWDCRWEFFAHEAKFSRNVQQVGYTLLLVPKPEAYIEAGSVPVAASLS